MYILAKELYDERTAEIAAIIFLFIPWNVLWFGRAQTDPLMVALMTLAIALYVRAYKNDTSMLPFGIALGLAVLPVVLVWSYFQGIKRKQIINAMLCFFAGMIPLLVWLSYYEVSGNFTVIFNIIFGELAYRSEPFSDLSRVVLFTAAGISPLVIAAAAYQILKERNVKNILAIWLLIYGAFVLVRTPPSHEYYSLPLMAPVAILAGAELVRISGKLNQQNAMLFAAVVVVSTILSTFILLSYSGDLSYTATKDVGEFLRDYMDRNPENDYLVLIQMKYTPQIAWYSGLRFDGGRQMYSTGDDLSVEYVDGIIKNYDKNKVFLVSELDKSGRSLLTDYTETYESRYEADFMKLYNPGISGLAVLRVR